MMRIHEVSKNAYEILWHALNAAKPKTDEDFFQLATVRKLWKSHLIFEKRKMPGPNGELVDAELFKADFGGVIDVYLESPDFRYLERIFKEAREGGTFTAVGAEWVVEAIHAVKAAKELKPEELPAASGGNGTNRIAEVAAK